jgi:hypothetical protein
VEKEAPRVEVEPVCEATGAADIARAVDLLLVVAAAGDGARAPQVRRAASPRAGRR